MHPQPLIHAIVQQTMVLVAHLATAGGARSPLARVANRVFADLSEQLAAQGVAKTVIADMFGMALSTYHRRVRAALESKTDAGRSVWEAVLEFIRTKEPVAASVILARFARDDSAVVASVLRDLCDSGIVYRAGRGPSTVYRAASAADFAGVDAESRSEALRHILWLTVVRKGPIAIEQVAEELHEPVETCREMVEALVSQGLIESRRSGTRTVYDGARFDLPIGGPPGWEAAVLDHFQAVVTALCVKLRLGSYRSQESDAVGGSTYTLDVWPGHPMEAEARGTLGRVRTSIAELRERIDSYNTEHGRPTTEAEREVTVYVGQYVKTNDDNDGGDGDA